MKRALAFANANKNDCRDLRIAQIELKTTSGWRTVYDDMPLQMDIDDTFEARHSIKTGTVWRVGCPKAKIFVLYPTQKSFEWIRDNDIDIVSVSLSGCPVRDDLEILINAKTFLLIAPGNEGVMSWESKKKHWTSIGAYHLDGGLQEYSARGLELDFVCLSNLIINGSKTKGTSISTPFCGVLLAQYIQLHKDFFGYKPSVAKIHQFMLDNTTVVGTREESGNGLFLLPKAIKFTTDPKNKGRKRIERFVLTFYKNGLSEKRKKQLLKLWGGYLDL